MVAYFPALPVFILTVSLALFRPKVGPIRINHAGAAVIGALATVALGAVPLGAVPDVLLPLVHPLVTIVSLMVITLIADRVGLFELLARFIAKRAGGDGRRLFAYVFFLGAATGALFTNDATVLIFTPLVYQLIEDVQDGSWSLRNKIPYYFAVLNIANLVAPFVIGNPINIIVASLFRVDFLEYARWMALPALISAAATYACLRLLFGRAIPERYDSSKIALAVRSEPRAALVGTGGVLVLVLVGFFVGHSIGIPIWTVALGGAVLLLSSAVKGVDRVRVIKHVAWDVLIFVVGIFIVVNGLKRAGLTDQLLRLVVQVAGSSPVALIFTDGIIAALCSSVMNNHPTAYAFALAIDDMTVGPLVKRMLIFSSLIGGDLGPKMLPIGSLAALLWLRLLRDKGIHIDYRSYVRIGIPVTMSAVLLSLLALSLEFLLVTSR